jgi:hypothetical protein
MKVIFDTQEFVEHKISEDNLVRLHVFGVSLQHQPDRPILILKDDTGNLALAVGLSPIETGVLLQQSNKAALSTPHKFSELLLQSLNIKIERAVFESIKDHQQFVRIFLENHPSHGSILVKAEEAMSLCFQLEVPIFASKKYIQKSRVMTAQTEGLVQGLALNPAIVAKNHEYLN